MSSRRTTKKKNFLKQRSGSANMPYHGKPFCLLNTLDRLCYITKHKIRMRVAVLRFIWQAESLVQKGKNQTSQNCYTIQVTSHSLLNSTQTTKIISKAIAFSQVQTGGLAGRTSPAYTTALLGQGPFTKSSGLSSPPKFHREHY